MLPTYLVIGAMKSATSTLCSLLDAHPDVFVTTPKEPDFFCRPEIHARGLEWYETLFAGAGAARARGEGSTCYSKCAEFPGTAARVAAALPNVKLIYLVRDPLARIESQWGYHQRHEGFGPSITLGALQRDERILGPSRYRAQLAEYRRYYEPERFLVLFHEELEADPQATMRRAFDFIGVDPTCEIAQADRRAHVSTFRTDRALLVWLKRSQLFQRVQRSIPVEWKAPARALLQRSEGRPRWEPAARRYAVEVLRDDTAAFLREHGKPANYWPMTP